MMPMFRAPRRAATRPAAHPAARRRRPAVLLVALLLAAALACCHCGRLVPAIGAGSTITLVTHLPSGHPAQQALRATLTRPVVMVRPEPAFELESTNAAGMSRVRHARNLVLLADLSRRDALSREVERLVGERLLAAMRAGRRYHAFYADVWASGQTVLVLAATDPQALATAIEAHGDELYEAFERRVVQQTTKLLFVSGEQKKYTRYLRSRYGWSIRVPKGYRVSEDAEQRVVRLWMPEGGTRLLFVHWEDGVRRLPSAEACIERRARIVWAFDQDTVLADRTRSQRVDFLGDRALELAGVWQNERYKKGGPFRTYCLLAGDRFYMIDLLVFHPEDSKVGLMRQLEALALTFKDERPGDDS